ncbi:MAG: bifunctional heptose 7-phosphate kinase/heptose 1-phosphate adenyltransferase [Desulfuromonas sp.]|nr:MAG: bifunctional heptose 7-phosphate kinase/heptose 1-phosphate adenyltransferase [Desulfuromonas sp.]
MNDQNMKKILNAFKQTRILVVGDLMLDEYLWGHAARISPEAPVPVVGVSDEDLRLGGAGNVINNLLALGCMVDVASVVGDDPDGRELTRQLQALSIDVQGVVADPQRTTTRKTRIVANNQQMLRIDREKTSLLSVVTEQKLIDIFLSCDRSYQAILVSDYLKGVLTPTVLQTLISHAKQLKIPVIVDPKGADYSRYTGATLLTPNRAEAELATGRSLRRSSDLIQIGRALIADYQLESLVLTRSEEGMTIFTGKDETHLSTKAREVFDVTGAGDTVLAVLGAGIAAGLRLEEAAWLSNVAAGVVVGKIGTSTVSPQEILEAALPSHHEDHKIVAPDVLQDILEDVKAQKKTVVFTNGCFDLLHVGHVKYLQKAKQLGDVLVLGLNSDRSIRRLKGELRPLIEQQERAHILAALDCVDYLVIFDEDTPYELIKIVRPDILVKGGDYTAEAVVGKDVVERDGGRVELITFVDGKSTTSLIEKIVQQYNDPAV